MTRTKQDAIRQAALELFSKKGVDATSTREIAKRADTAEGNIYRHFDGKDDLVSTLFEECAAQLHDMLIREIDDVSNPADRLRRMVEGIFTFAEEQPRAFEYLLSVHQHVLERIDLDGEPLPMQLFTETLQSGMETGQFRRLSPVLAAGWIVGMTQRSILLQGTRLVSLPRSEIVSATVDAAMRLVKLET